MNFARKPPLHSLTREIRTTGITEDTEEFHTKTITEKLLYTLFRSARDYNNGKIGSRIEFNATSRAIEFSNSHPFNTDIFFPLRAKENSLIL